MEVENVDTVCWSASIAVHTGLFISLCQVRPRVVRALDSVGRAVM